MRKLICLGFIIFPLLASAQSEGVLRTVSNIEVQNGQIVESGVLADDQGVVFVEMTRGSYVANELDRNGFSGEILPPELIEPIAKAPRARMREIISFEFFTDRADTALFVDRYALVSEKTLLREQILTGNTVARSSGAQFLTQFTRDQNIGQAALWRYVPQDESWDRIGGITSNSNQPDTDIFSVILFQTGIYTIWDEDPAPVLSENTDPSLIQLAEASPFPSVLPPEPINETVFFEDEFASSAPVFQEQTVGLIPATGVITPVETSPLDATPPGEFSQTFLETIQPPAVPETITTETIRPPAGATLPQTGLSDLDSSINWVNYVVLLLFISVIGGSIWVVRSKPY